MIRYSFENPSELVKFGEKDVNNLSRGSRKTKNPGWFGTSTYEEAVEQFLYGWEEGFNILKNVTESLPKLPAANKKRKRSVAGHYSVAAYTAAGVPEDMMIRSVKRERKWSKQLTIGFDCVISAGISIRETMNKGALIVGLIDTLEAFGVSCELHLLCLINNLQNTETLIIDMPVKQLNESISLNRLAFPLASPSMLRRMMFSVMENMPRDKVLLFGAHTNGGYGYPAKLPEAIASEYDLIVDSTHFDYKGKAVDFILESSKKLGIDIEINQEALERKPPTKK